MTRILDGLHVVVHAVAVPTVARGYRVLVLILAAIAFLALLAGCATQALNYPQCSYATSARESVRCKCEVLLAPYRDNEVSVEAWRVMAFQEYMSRMYSIAAAYDNGDISMAKVGEDEQALNAMWPELEKQVRAAPGSYARTNMREVRCSR